MDTITFASRNGKMQITLTVVEYIAEPLISVQVDGKYYGQGRLLHADKCSELVKNQCRDSNSVGIIRTDKGVVALDQSKFEWAYNAIEAKRAEINARPEVIRQKLIQERKKLQDEIGYIVAGAHDQHVATIEHLSEHGFSLKTVVDYSEQEVVARKALIDFDLKNPEVKKWMEEERNEQIEQNMWN